MRRVLFFVLTMLMPAAAPARPLYFENLTAMFGIQEGDRLHACGVCHERWKGTGPRNPFGTLVEQQLYVGKSIRDAITAVLPADADGDGTSNGDELTVFHTLPGEGRWETALLADGNIGIGGDPRALLDRVARILAAGGRVVADLAPAGAGLHTRSVRLRTPTLQSAPFRWAIVGADAIGSLAVATGFQVLGLHRRGARWFAVLEKSR